MENNQTTNKKPTENNFFDSFLAILDSQAVGVDKRISKNKARWLLTNFRIKKQEATEILKQLESEGSIRMTRYSVFLGGDIDE